MKAFILFSSLLELIVGLLLFFAANKIPQLAELEASELALLRLYGAAAVALGIFGWSAWSNFNNEVLVGTFLSSFLIFHIGVALASRAAFATGALPDMMTTYLHSFLALITAYFWLKNRG